MRKAATFLGLALGVYLIVRAAAEPFVIDMSNPATYRNDWGGQACSASSWFTADQAW
jgi:hypothetical protein